MDFQYVTLAFLLVFMIVGLVKALWKPFLKNVIRFACVPVAFFITWLLQLLGVFEDLAITAATPVIDALINMEMSYDTHSFVIALASTFMTSAIFVVIFILILALLRLIFSTIVYNAVVKNKAKKEEEKPQEEGTEKVTEKEKGWKKAISLASGTLAGFLIFGVMLMPLFYTFDLLASASHVTRDMECDDSSIYRAVEVIDDYVIEPYEKSVVTNAYKYTGISSLASSTIALGGKMTTEAGEEIYATKTAKTLLSSGVDLAICLQSHKAEDSHVSTDLKALLDDPIMISLLSDLAISEVEKLEAADPEADHENVLSVVMGTIKKHYTGIDKQEMASDIRALGNAFIYLNDEGYLAKMLSGGDMLEAVNDLVDDKPALEETVHILTDVSSYDCVLKYIYEFEIAAIGHMLNIPEDDAEAYDVLVERLVNSLNSIEQGSINVGYVEYFASEYAKTGKSVEEVFKKSEGSIDRLRYNHWIEYRKAWKAIHDAFSASCEDTSMSKVCLNIDGQMYFYYPNEFVWKKAESIPKDYSHYASLYQHLIAQALSREGEVTEEMLMAWFDSYDGSDAESAALAKRMINKDEFESKAVTLEIKVESGNFDSWTEETRREDSKRIVKILFKLKGVATNLSEETDTDEEYINSIIDLLVVFGETMDIMEETVCVNELPEHLAEGMLQNDVFRKYIGAGVVVELNEMVNNEEITYSSFMHSIESIILLVVDKVGEFGGEVK